MENKKVKKRFGIFRLKERGVRTHDTIYIPSNNEEKEKETDLIVASNETFDSYEEAETKLIEMPSPSMYCIMPVYFIV